jgi:hypothetical protein
LLHALSMKQLKRYAHVVNAVCLQCDTWLCAMAGTYTGLIQCKNCGILNEFRDSAKPCETKAA